MERSSVLSNYGRAAQSPWDDITDRKSGLSRMGPCKQKTPRSNGTLMQGLDSKKESATRVDTAVKPMAGSREPSGRLLPLCTPVAFRSCISLEIHA